VEERGSGRIAPSENDTAEKAVGRLQPLPLPRHPEARRGGASRRRNASAGRRREAWEAADRDQEAAMVAWGCHFLLLGASRCEPGGERARTGCGKERWRTWTGVPLYSARDCLPPVDRGVMVGEGGKREEAGIWLNNDPCTSFLVTYCRHLYLFLPAGREKQRQCMPRPCTGRQLVATKSSS
jgi:hypothetical protein